jgi:hypothetical protein
VGKYLFYRQNNLGGHVDVGSDDAPLLGEGWGRPERHAGERGRRLLRRARFFAPLDEPRSLRLVLRTRALGDPRQLRVLVNGVEAGHVAADAGAWREHTLRVSARFWRRELNEVVLESGDEAVVVAWVVFVPVAS